MRLRVFSCLLLLGLSACVQPTTRQQTFSQDELQQEEKAQIAFAGEDALRRQEKRVAMRLKMQERLQRVFAPIARAGVKICSEMAYKNKSAECVFEAMLQRPKRERERSEEDEGSMSGVNAYADGEMIVVNTAMMRFAKEDDELAFVLAHELAHNIMQHSAAGQTNATVGRVLGALLDAAAYDQGLRTDGSMSELGETVGVLSYSRSFEHEADYVGLYIMATAGYDIKKAPHYWRRMSARTPDAIYLTTTHPTNPERFVSMQKTVAEIEGKKKHGAALVPEFKEQ